MGPGGKVIMLEAGAIGYEYVYQGTQLIDVHVIFGPNGNPDDSQNVDYCAAVTDAIG